MASKNLDFSARASPNDLVGFDEHENKNANVRTRITAQPILKFDTEALRFAKLAE
jgi:hypothetical protein